MILKLPTVSTPCIYSNPTNKSVTNTIMDAVDAAATAQALYPHAYTATLKSTFDTAVFHTTDATLTLDTANRYTCGVFLSNTQPNNQLFHVTGTIKAWAETTGAGFAYYFIFGQTDASTITQSDAAASNLLSNYIILPQANSRQNSTVNLTAPGQHFYASIDELVWLDNSPDNYDPVCFAAVLDNNSGTSAGIDMFHIYLSIRNASAMINCETSSGV